MTGARFACRGVRSSPLQPTSCFAEGVVPRWGGRGRCLSPSASTAAPPAAPRLRADLPALAAELRVPGCGLEERPRRETFPYTQQTAAGGKTQSSPAGCARGRPPETDSCGRWDPGGASLLWTSTGCSSPIAFRFCKIIHLCLVKMPAVFCIGMCQQQRIEAYAWWFLTSFSINSVFSERGGKFNKFISPKNF